MARARNVIAMIVSAATGIPIDRITHIDGDTYFLGRRHRRSRSLQLGGSAVVGARDAVIEHARSIAAQQLEADVADVLLDSASGGFHVAGVPATVRTWSDIAQQVEADGEQLSADHVFNQPGATFPFGAHVAIVEVDTETGRVTIVHPLRLTIVAPFSTRSSSRANSTGNCVGRWPSPL